MAAKKKTPAKRRKVKAGTGAGRKNGMVNDGKGLTPDQQKAIIDQQAELAQFVLVPAGALQQLQLGLAEMALKLGALASMVMSQAQPLGKNDGE